MRAVIFANGEFPSPERAREWVSADDYTIAADGGLHHALSVDVLPDLLIGDLDSVQEKEMERVKVATLGFSAEKDETDLELALLHAVDQGADEIIVLSAMGGRIDHTIANLTLLALPELEGIDVRLVQGSQEAFLVRDEHVVEGQPGDTLSLIPFAGDAVGVMAEGVKWSLSGETLRFGPARGVSNVLIEEQAVVSVQEGLLLCVHTFGE